MLRPNTKPPVVSQHWWFGVFMISIIQFKKLLGRDAEGLDDNQIKSIQAAMYTLADATIENWMLKGKARRMFLRDSSDPTYSKMYLWYPKSTKAIIQL